MFLLILDREEGRGEERDTSMRGRNIDRLLPAHVLTENRTGDLLVHGMTLKQLRYTGQGGNLFMKSYNLISPHQQGLDSPLLSILYHNVFCYNYLTGLNVPKTGIYSFIAIFQCFSQCSGYMTYKCLLSIRINVKDEQIDVQINEFFFK